MTLWMVWAVTATLLLALSGLLTERIARARGHQTRFIWIGVLFGGAALQAWSWFRPPPSVASVSAQPASGSGVDLGALLAEATPIATTSVASWLAQWDGAAVVAWIMGSVAVSMVLGVGLTKLGRRTRRWTSASVDGEDVLLSDGFGPALVGFLTPRIVMPRWALALDREQRHLALVHESEHRAAHDTLLLLLGSIACAVVPWNPAVWWAVSRLRQAVELDCDLRVLRTGVSPSSYGALLIDLSARSATAPFPVAALARPVSLLERRLTMMTNDVRRVGPIKTVALAAGAALLTVAACETPAPSALQDQEGGVEAGVVSTSAENFVVRGSDEAQPWVYVDGVRLEGAGMADLEGLDPDAIDRIEVVKGPEAMELFGPQATNGVVQIFTRGDETEPSALLHSEEVQGGILRLREVDETDDGLHEPGSEPLAGGLVELRLEPAPERAVSEVDLGEPIIYVDGVRQNAPLDELGLDQDQIDRVEVLKGPAAAALLGEEASNGVVQIFLKKS